MDNFYRLIGDIDVLAKEIYQTLKENHMSVALVDRSHFVSKDSRCQIDTYQIYEIAYSGYITINVYFFQPQLTTDELEVKVAIISTFWKESTMKMRKIQKEIDGVVHTHHPD